MKVGTAIIICTNCNGRGLATYEEQGEGTHGRLRAYYVEAPCRTCNGDGRLIEETHHLPIDPTGRPPHVHRKQ